MISPIVTPTPSSSFFSTGSSIASSSPPSSFGWTVPSSPNGRGSHEIGSSSATTYCSTWSDGSGRSVANSLKLSTHYGIPLSATYFDFPCPSASPLPTPPTTHDTLSSTRLPTTWNRLRIFSSPSTPSKTLSPPISTLPRRSLKSKKTLARKAANRLCVVVGIESIERQYEGFLKDVEREAFGVRA